MRYRSSRLAALVAAGALVVVPLAGAGAAGSQDPVFRVGDPTGLVKRVNAVRVAHGLVPLRESPALQQAALVHSRAMLKHGVFAHESPDGTSFSRRVRRFYPNAGFTSWRAAENLLSSNQALRPGRAVGAWLDSPPHRRTLLDPTLRDVGIATVFTQAAPGAFGGRPTWVVTMDAGARHRP
jgi:uncharacterized protein YkwD